jgi:hypothetical protein
MMAIYLLDNSLKVEVFYDPSDSEFEDNICICFVEECPDDEKLFLAGETNIYLTPDEACHLAQAVIKAVKHGHHNCIDIDLTE